MPGCTRLDIPQAQLLLEALSEAGGEGRFVGGCVRDTLIGRPFTDIDIATNLKPELVTETLQARGIKVVPTGILHGTVTAVINNRPFEITTLRKDIACFGRHAEVAFTNSWKEDASRRDFTMNAMFMDGAGELYDFFDGRKDLEAGVVRFVGDAEKRITEDYLRMLRLFRFHAHYGKGEILPEQLDACARHVSALRELSGERIQQEMKKLLGAPEAYETLRPMQEIGLLPAILTLQLEKLDLEALEMLETLERQLRRAPEWVVRLAALLRSAGAGEKRVRELASFWRLSNDDAFTLLTLAIPVFSLTSACPLRERKKALRTLGRQYYEQVVLLQWVAEKREGKEDDNAFREMLVLAQEWEIPQFPLRGKDILELGVEPGERVGELIKKAERYWEGEDYKSTKKELLGFVKRELEG